MSDYEKKGYLASDFRVFRLKDSTLKPIAFHYHDFHKIILFLSGNVDYVIEGKTYHLTARVIYVSPAFLERWQRQDPEHTDLGHCFLQARETASVMHQAPGTSHDLLFHMDKLEKAAHGEGFANGLYTELLFIEFMILINRLLEGHELAGLENATYDPKIQEVLAYVNQHLADELSIDALAAHTYTSKFYLMRKFKADTGYALHQYIRSKRLLLARDMLRSDLPIAQIASEVGFADYSTFSRAFKEMFKCSPREYRNTH